MMLGKTKEKYFCTKSVRSPASAKTFKTFQSGGKLTLPKLTGKRGDLNLKWSLRGFERVGPFSAKPPSQRVFVFSPVKEKKPNLKKIRLKDEIVKAIADEMKSIELSLSVAKKKLDLKTPQLGKDEQTSVKTKKFFSTIQENEVGTVKKTLNFGFEEDRLEVLESEDLLPEIKKRVEACCAAIPEYKESWLTSNSKIMKNDYEYFKKNYFDRLSQVLVEYSLKNKAPKLQQFIMKFLLDIQSESDVRELSKKDTVFLQKFIVDRYFKLLKQKILTSLEQNGVFQILLKSIAKKPKNFKLEFSVSQMNKLTYSHFRELFNQNRDSGFFSGEFFNATKLDKLFDARTSAEQLNDSLGQFYFDINRFLSFLIIKLISARYQRAGYVFNDIEHIDEDVVFIVAKFVRILVNLSEQNLSKKARIMKLEHLTQSLNSMFYCWNNQMYFLITQYTKNREMREYMDRKRKSQFIKPRRNDEKLKKIYKRIMKNMLADFKFEFYGQKRKSKQSQKNMNDMEFEEFLKDMNSKMFLSDSEDDPSILGFDVDQRHPPRPPKGPDAKKNAVFPKTRKRSFFKVEFPGAEPDLNPFSRSASSKRLTSKQQEIKFYEFYFGKFAESQKIPLNFFFDPLKQKFENKKYKSFTIKYFKLLLNSERFKKKVVGYIQANGLVLDMLGEYSKSLADLFQSVPTILLDQHRPKSKFLWTSYEFYFAMYFFKDKFNLYDF